MKLARRAMTRPQLEQGREPAPRQPPHALARHRLDDDLAAVDFLAFDQLDPAMMGAVGDPRLGRPHPVAPPVLVRDRHPERPEPERAPHRPDQITDHTEVALQLVRHRLGDHRRQADRRGIDEIIAVDAAKVDPLAYPVGDDVDRAVHVLGDAQRARETVGGAQRDDREHRVLAHEEIDIGRQRPVAAAKDDHRRLGNRVLDRRVHLVGIVDRMRLDQLDPGGGQLGANLVKRFRPATAHRVDDQYGLLGEGLHLVPDWLRGLSLRQRSNSLCGKDGPTKLSRHSNAPRPLRAVDPRHARRAPPPSLGPDLAVVRVRRLRAARSR